MVDRRRAVSTVALALTCASCSRVAREPRARQPVEAVPEASADEAAKTEAETQVTSPPATVGCDPGQVLLFASPEHPAHGRPLRVMAVTDRRVDATLSLEGDGGASPIARIEDGAGPPFVWVLSLEDVAAGKLHVTFRGTEACAGRPIADLDVPVAPHAWSHALPAPRTSLWLTRRSWTPLYENLYSAWITYLFRAPADTLPSWGALDQVLSDPARNFLFDHLGAKEDEEGVSIRPDCADLPYFLRAYFSFKLGLPFGWSRCSRVDSSGPPTCSDFATNEDPFPVADAGPQPPVPVWADPARPAQGPWENNARRFDELLRTTLADSVQSGAGRTAAADEESDYYPVLLTRDSLRAGTIYADPYGHVLMVATRVEQTPSAAGALFAVDAQPDATVARKRFWRGNFLFAVDPMLGSAGFKRFRPIVRDRATGRLRRAKDGELADDSATDQYEHGVDGFYDKVEDLLSPEPLDPLEALRSTIQALDEQVRSRVGSVDNGRKFLADATAAAEMPDGAKIFETHGAWEDFSTPSRDLRLLLAIDVTLGVPGNVVRRPERYKMPAGRTAAQVSAELEKVLATQLRERSFEYVRSDGSSWSLKLGDVVARQTALEMAYDPNDCVEVRWGAQAGSEEASTCHAHAPAEQQAKMAEYRPWFHQRTRPPR
jgi:hypothetical protein